MLREETRKNYLHMTQVNMVMPTLSVLSVAARAIMRRRKGLRGGEGEYE